MSNWKTDKDELQGNKNAVGILSYRKIHFPI